MQVVSGDDAIRAAAFAYLRDLLEHSGGLVARADLTAFTFQGERIPLVSAQQGIRKPRRMEAALSILTTFASSPELRPYDDAVGPDGYPRYKWRGSNAQHADNRALRLAMDRSDPLIWFVGVAPGIYDALFPVWLVGEEPADQQFVVALDDIARDNWQTSLSEETLFNPVRRYAEVIRKERLHQRVFRDQVLLAYETQCALCRLRHAALLDAAHIKEDAAGGEPVVPNGVAMCAIHHRAFDAHVLGVRPDYQVEVRASVLTEVDGPTLQHALQALHGSVIQVPGKIAQRPDRELLEERYEVFRAAG